MSLDVALDIRRGLQDTGLVVAQRGDARANAWIAAWMAPALFVNPCVSDWAACPSG